MDERDVVAVPEQSDDLIGLGLAHQAVIDEHAGELVADGLVDQHRRDRRIDAARQPADHPPGPDLRANRAIASSRNAFMVQSPLQPAMWRTKLRMSARPAACA